MQSRAVVMTESGELEQRELEIGEPGPGEVLLRVERNGICGTDVHMHEGGLDLDYPVVPGHEFVGTVEHVGENVETDAAGAPVAEGDAATVVPGISCDDCWYCNNMPTRRLACNHRRVYGFRSVDDPPRAHGGMSEYVVVEHDATFYRLPDDLPVALGALVEPLSVATHALERAYPPGVPHAREGFGIGKSVAVQGAGPIGLLACAAAATAGAGTIVAIDMVEDRLDLAREFGATDTVDVGDKDTDELVAAVQEPTPGGVGPDVVIEAVGHPEAVRQGIELPHNAGTFVEVGHYADAGTVEINPTRIVQKELDIYGSLAYPPGQFETAISMLQGTHDEFPYTDLFDHQVGFDDVADAYAAQASGEAFRATIHPEK
ncbi:MAG: zinc-binding dehydrogenase [Halobacteriaceae archaeon]